ncbi:hypothetical protein EDD18DRAFT_1106038 [Armillaria luteobubalina]|uniref:Uncharacterized protein n=1 Tax=Armillaria luteobubalina TaxID=153913 RepID=A0AA39Q5U2_9AGAR|nr:hypothetical protein EDD18DRAFT_1106038 [Armillaria luteobubalina]
MTTRDQRVLPSVEERHAAHNESSRRSYIKSLEPLVRKAARLLKVEVNSGNSHAQCSSELAEAMDSIDRLATQFSVLTHGSPECHVDRVYKQYLHTMSDGRPKGYRGILDNAILEMSTLEQSLQEFEHIILNWMGMGQEMKHYCLVYDPVEMMI